MMSEQNKTDSTIPAARSEFARRLRELRVPRGFRTARSLARTLDIDENRYTRYERAEVEPDLSMIRRICETLDVTPNELLGRGEGNANVERPDRQLANGLSKADRQGKDGAAIGSPAGSALGLPAAAWSLAEAAMQLKQAHLATNSGSSATTPLGTVTETGKLYRALMAQPFEAITELLADPTIADADATAAEPLRVRIEQLVALVKNQA